MKSELPLRLVLVDPPADVDYGIQRGRGSKYESMFVQRRVRRDVVFDFSIEVSEKAGHPNFTGDYIQGPPAGRFIYIDAGSYAGQKDTRWARRMIVRLDQVTMPTVRKALQKGHRLVARIRGTGEDGGPSCATVTPIGGWKVIKEPPSRRQQR